MDYLLYDNLVAARSAANNDGSIIEILDVVISGKRGFLLSSQSIMAFRQQHRRKRKIKAIASYPTERDLQNADTAPLPGLADINRMDAIASYALRSFDSYSMNPGYPVIKMKRRIRRLGKRFWLVAYSYPVAKAWRYAARLQRHFPPGKTALERLIAGEDHEVVMRDLRKQLNVSFESYTGPGITACIPENI